MLVHDAFKHLVAQMPHEEFHYFGDSAFALILKPKAQIAQRSCATQKFFIDEGAKALVIAFAILLALLLDASLRATYPHVPIVGVK